MLIYNDPKQNTAMLRILDSYNSDLPNNPDSLQLAGEGRRRHDPGHLRL